MKKKSELNVANVTNRLQSAKKNKRVEGKSNLCVVLIKW